MATRGGAAPATLEARIARYERIVAMRAQTPPMTYAAIGEIFGITKERVRTIEAVGRPGRAGRPSGPARAQRLRGKLGFWERERERATTPERRADAEARVASISAELARVS